MLMKIVKIALVVVVLGIVLGCLVGFQYISGAKRQIQNTIQDNIPISTELATLEEEISSPMVIS